MRLSDTIEEFIKMLMEDDNDEIQLQRNELADHFNCAPSQINYVLATRFTPELGYVTKSKRGGGGCIFVYKISSEKTEHLNYLINERIGNSLTKLESNNIVKYLLKEGIINNEMYNIISTAISDNSLAIPISDELKNCLRAKIIKEILISISLDEKN